MEDDLDISSLISKRQPPDACIPVFKHMPMLDHEASETAGKNVYKDMAFVEIIIPGNAKERVIRPVEDKDKTRWPEQWRKFEQFGEAGQEIDGTPIEEWPQATPGQVKTLRAADVMTVEQLATVSDLDLQSLGMGMVALRAKAQTYVAFKNDEIKIQKVSAENRKLKKSVTDLEKRLAEMQSRLEEIESAKHAEADRASGGDQGSTRSPDIVSWKR